MGERICPWWLGYMLISPIRRWLTESPTTLLSPYIQEGSTILEPGPGMGFFTLPMAQMAGPKGRVIAVDVQDRMLQKLRQRARSAGFEKRIETRLAGPESMNIADLAGQVDFVLAFAVVHEMPSVDNFFAQAASALKPGGLMLLAEPAVHVKPDAWTRELIAAQQCGLKLQNSPPIRRSLSALFQKA